MQITPKHIVVILHRHTQTHTWLAHTPIPLKQRDKGEREIKDQPMIVVVVDNDVIVFPDTFPQQWGILDKVISWLSYPFYGIVHGIFEGRWEIFLKIEDMDLFC